MQPFMVAGAAGSRRWFEASGQPIRMDGFRGGVVVIRDVTDRSLRQLQEQFVALAGHELRTPLTALIGSLELLLRTIGHEDDERARHYIELALSQSRVLTDLVQDLTDVIRMQTGQLPIARERLDLKPLIEEAVDLARPLGGQEIQLEISDDRLPIIGDARRLRQVLLNLISNAVQHGSSPSGLDVRARLQDHFIVLEVVDHGAGVAEQDRQRIFERFYQAGSDGCGLGVGLYLVQAIVTAHQGTIDVQPTRPRGTTFVTRLPLAE